MKFKVLVINLDSSVDRLTSMQQQLDQLGLAFERISAVRGSLLSAAEKAKVYDLKANQAKYDKVLNDGEIGCYLSHVRSWEKILEDHLDFALVLEDDAILTPEITGFISKLAELSQDWDYIKLSHGSKTKRIEQQLDLGDGLSLGTCLKLPSTTTGQFVSASGAKKLLASAYPIARPIDMDIQYWFEKDLRCLVTRPFPVLNGDFGSEINKTADRRQVERNRLKRLWQKLTYETGLWLSRSRMGTLPVPLKREER
ncbi:glycosyltransferase family 25 protein [Shewanella litorisediminis]|uniref:Glycosyltransferase family 25 protein n=1 Tax=Shewanella litorisediminis TaxID=1173586 RepID=A0ABX7G3Q5_9GAMM|nr:glycosyltransferase family 25 protein [Shewanella litorisediminis]MCL2919420.1 glycosyltransferase family 25 protein [Shewanella litorisediminis]QRH01965.1 glycosyltransferase family 25 protein [Shewanella litorisediminis]